MKKILYFGVLALMICAVFCSCTTERNGCQASSHFSGYGH